MNEYPILDWSKDGFHVSTDPALLQFSRIHAFLSTKAYWCLEIPEATLRKAISSSLCFGVYENKVDGRQVGFARVVGDGATFAWIADVYIEEEFRGKGLSVWLTKCLLRHPMLQGLRRICLATKDAHGVYEKAGFVRTTTPEAWMEIRKKDMYRAKTAEPDARA